jgi:hypothetical protein
LVVKVIGQQSANKQLERMIKHDRQQNESQVLLAPKMSCPSGTPIASVFLTEQNRAAMKASLSSLAGLPAQATPLQGRGKRLKNSPGTCPITRA